MAAFRILLAAAIVAALAAPAGADAAKRGSDNNRVSTRSAAPAKVPAPVRSAATVARRYWRAAPCGGKVKIATRRPQGPGTDASDAWVTFDSPLGANNLAAPAATYRRCTITLARRRWPTPASMTADWDILCATMVHEMGHLLGRQHDLQRGSIMVPVFTDGSSVPSLCRKSRPRAARRAR